MEKSRIISVRLPESLIQRLDELTREYHYWKRNAIIEKSLQAVAFSADYSNFKRILNWWRPSGVSMELTFQEKKKSSSDEEK